MFTENMIKYSVSGEIGNCPICHSKLIVEAINTPIRDNYYVTCSVCKKTEYFTGTTDSGDKLNQK